MAGRFDYNNRKKGGIGYYALASSLAYPAFRYLARPKTNTSKRSIGKRKMAYRRNYRKKTYRRRRYGRRNNYRRQRYKAAIKSIELKTHDVVESGLSLNTTGAIELLSGIAVGDTVNHREGQYITPVKLQINFRITGNTGGSVASACRIIIFQDYDTRGALPGTTDLLTGAPFTQSLKAIINRNRFRILFDKRYIVASAAEQDGFEIVMDKMNKKWSSNKAKIAYINTSAIITSAGKGSLYIFYCGSLAADVPTLEYSSRLRFYG